MKLTFYLVVGMDCGRLLWYDIFLFLNTHMSSPDNNFVQESFNVTIAYEHIRHDVVVSSVGRWYGIDDRS